MTKANDLASLLDANGDVVSSALDNVPPSNDASALSTGTLPDGRFPATLPAVSGANLTGIPTPTLTSLGIANHNQLAVDASGYVAANSLDVNDRVLVNNTGNQFLGYDTGGTTLLSRIGASTGINDFISNGTVKRMFVGDTSGDVTVGTSNGNLTPTNSFIHLQHNGEISMGAGAGPAKDIVLDTSGNLTVAGNISAGGGLGKVAQVVTYVDTSYYSVSGANQTLTWSINITPTSASSKILLQWVIFWNSTNPNSAMFVLRNSSNLSPNISVAGAFSGTGHFHDWDEAPSNVWNIFPQTMIAHDTPASTSQQTYSMGIENVSGTAPLYSGRSPQSVNYRSPSFVGYAMEILP